MRCLFNILIYPYLYYLFVTLILSISFRIKFVSYILLFIFIIIICYLLTFILSNWNRIISVNAIRKCYTFAIRFALLSSAYWIYSSNPNVALSNEPSSNPIVHRTNPYTNIEVRMILYMATVPVAIVALCVFANFLISICICLVIIWFDLVSLRFL